MNISIPAEIPLVFSGSTGAYGGSGNVYAYGHLGNAYAGVRVLVDTEAESYGKAAVAGKDVDISPYLTAGFQSGSAADFTPGQVLENGTALSEGEDAAYMDELTVSVMGAAFLQSGAGDYQIPVPLRIEFFQ